MRKIFLLSAEFEVTIEEDILYPEDECSTKRKLLLMEFLKNKLAVKQLYESWLIYDLLYNEHAQDFKKQLNLKKDKDILFPVLNELPVNICHFFKNILDSESDEEFRTFEKFFEQFPLLKLKKATFKEIKAGENNERQHPRYKNPSYPGNRK